MASLNVTIDVSKLLQQVGVEIDAALIARLGELLSLSRDDALDWLVYKVAQFRGVSELDVLSWLRLADPAVVPDSIAAQSACRGMTYQEWLQRLTGKA
jgi:hypothetical protein